MSTYCHRQPELLAFEYKFLRVQSVTVCLGSRSLFNGRTRTAYLYHCVWSGILSNGLITPWVHSGVTKRIV